MFDITSYQNYANDNNESLFRLEKIKIIWQNLTSVRKCREICPQSLSMWAQIETFLEGKRAICIKILNWNTL